MSDKELDEFRKTLGKGKTLGLNKVQEKCWNIVKIQNSIHFHLQFIHSQPQRTKWLRLCRRCSPVYTMNRTSQNFGDFWSVMWNKALRKSTNTWIHGTKTEHRKEMTTKNKSWMTAMFKSFALWTVWNKRQSFESKNYSSIALFLVAILSPFIFLYWIYRLKYHQHWICLAIRLCLSKHLWQCVLWQKLSIMQRNLIILISANWCISVVQQILLDIFTLGLLYAFDFMRKFTSNNMSIAP